MNFLFIICVCLLIFYISFLFAIWIGVRKIKLDGKIFSTDRSISIIIPFRNEESNLPENLKSIERAIANYDKVEVLYIDDNSTDDSVKVLSSQIRDQRIKVLQAKDSVEASGHKKNAIETGIETASGEIIMLTDADCSVPHIWLDSMVSSFDPETAFVVGPVTFHGDKKLFGKIQKLEFDGLMISAAGLIGIGKPVTCSAANIAFMKKVFEEVNGFEGIKDFASGDDELLMQKIRRLTAYKIKYCWKNEALVKTKTNKDVGKFINQRKRWASKGLFYKNKLIVASLTIVFLFYLSILLQLIFALMGSTIFLFMFITTFFVKSLFELMVIDSGRDLFPNRKIYKYFFVAELLQIPYILFAAASGAFGNISWKGRKVKR